MPRFSVSLSMMFTEFDFMKRFEEASKVGFKAVEYMFPYAYEKKSLKEELEKHGLIQVLFNLPPGNFDGGERGIAGIPGREDEFKRGVDLAIDYAKTLNVSRINCLVGIPPKDAEPQAVRECLVKNLSYAAEVLEKENIMLLIEALNTYDLHGYHLSRTSDAISIIEEVNHQNLYLLYDIYHMQMMEGNLINTIKKHITKIGHIHIADVPGRHEPGTGEINFQNIFRTLDEIGYEGWIGCEYKPLSETTQSLSWVRPYLGGM